MSTRQRSGDVVWKSEGAGYGASAGLVELGVGPQVLKQKRLHPDRAVSQGSASLPEDGKAS